MLRTRITELFGIEHPIVQGGLQRVGRAELAAAVSAAGGLGLITAGSYPTPDEFVEELRKARGITGKPIGVNISLGIRRAMDGFVEAAVREGVPAVFTSGRNPEAYVPSLKKAGVRWAHVVTSVRHALKAENLGADAVVLVGYEGGGHPGMDEVSTMALIPRAVDALKVPVIAAGGIADGRGLVAALALGAEGVQMGTAFVTTRECPAHPSVKELYIKSGELDTLIIEKSIRNAQRVLKTPAALRVLEMESRGAALEELLEVIGGQAYIKAIEGGDLAAGVISCGQGVGLVKEEVAAGELVRRIVEEAKWVIRALNARLG